MHHSQLSSQKHLSNRTLVVLLLLLGVTMTGLSVCATTTDSMGGSYLRM